jgi:hypothetical protein
LSAHSKESGLNGTHIETLIMGHPSNPANLIDWIEEKTEIKSCVEYVPCSGYAGRRAGHFKIHIEQHKELIKIDGYYLFVVQDGHVGTILIQKKIKARTIEKRFKLVERKVTKHQYFSLNHKKVLNLKRGNMKK